MGDPRTRYRILAEQHGELAWWVNNAGIDWASSAHPATEEHIDHGPAGTADGADVRSHRRRPAHAQARGGSIVNVSSIQGVAAFPGYYVYASAKAGLLMATKSIAVDYGAFGIRANVGAARRHRDAHDLRHASAGRRPRGGAPARGGAGPDAPRSASRRRSQTWSRSCTDWASYVNGAEIMVDGGAGARCFAYPPLALPE